MRYDLTSVPEKYHSSRALARADLRRWVNLVREFIQPEVGHSLIDLGCGTGRFTVPLAEQLGLPVIGVDPSRRMLRAAKGNTNAPGVTYRQGRAESIPVEANSGALIFISNAIHHVKNLDRALQEMARALRPHGIVFVRNYSRENLESLYYLRFFPEAIQISVEMVWPRSTLVEKFTTRGFVLLAQGTVRQEASPHFQAYVSKIGSRVYSDLALISDQAFQRGMARMNECRAPLRDGPVMEDVDYFVFQRS